MTQTLVPPTATPTTGDRIRSVTLSHVVLPLPNPVSDAKVLTGRQKPLTETVMIFVELTTEPENLASQRVIERNGGQLVERFEKAPAYGGGTSLRYRITL